MSKLQRTARAAAWIDLLRAGRRIVKVEIFIIVD
ncbi:hypothetical protein HNQ85_003193 [Anoxybacillus calidus]|uniref:Uncharacterized protein n=1 Tax=[Anoxybacillus] calidus TaxID=575178 RepID=A0A7V9Z2T6_9BACL|nr:hypothetical protein [Anoxybacillus calidus]